jgi:hypothetical protein
MGLLDDDEELLRRPAFGVFPQMQPRRRLQDREASANVPLDVTRGRLAGLLGLLPDTLNFMGRSPMPTEMFGETQYEPAPQMPYGSEYYLQNLPLKPTSRIGEVAGQAGAFVPLNPMPAARAVAAGARALGPTAVGMGERYLQRQGLMPGVVEGESAGLLGGPIKPQAPVSPIGFYSAAEQAALALPRKSGTGDAFLNDLMKGQDVKKDELSWMGLDDYLKGKPNVTRQEVQDFIAGNRVDVQEVRLGDKEVKFPSTIGLMKREEVLNKYQPKLDALYAEDANYANLTPQRYEELGQEIRALERQRDIEADAAYVMPSFKPAPTKYERYQLPGGENYREILLTLPNQWDKPRAAQIANETRIKELRQEMYGTSGSNEIRSEISRLQNENTALQKEISEAPIYKSSHFDQPNILAHMRVNDRIDADGKKMLLIEELQSDWHQGGREYGYKSKSGEYGKKITDEEYQRASSLQNRQRDGLLTPQEAAEFSDIMSRHQASIEGSRVPDAPFKGTWHQLALKRALKYAADNGYDRVGLTTGSQQAERYDLSKQISKVMWDKETGRLTAYDKNVTGRRSDGRTVVDESGVTESKLSDYIGKEAAQKLIKESPDEEGVRFLSGLDLQIGGEGMKKYYDEIYPSFLEKQGKKYNAKTGETQIPTGRSNVGGMPSMYPDKQSIRYIDISPEMRGGVSKGQPLFTAAPIGGIGLGAGTQNNEMPDAVRQYMADPASGLLQDENERKKLGGLLFR